MKATCPTCNEVIPAAQINVATDVASCSKCGEVFALSSLVGEREESIREDDESLGFDINDPPKGAWFIDEFDGWRIGGSTRSPLAFFLVPFMCVWSGGSLGGIYGSQILKGEFDLFMSLFGIPFLLGTIVIGSMALMTVLGRVDVTADRNGGRIFTGVGPFGWTRRFVWSEISRIEEDVLYHQNNGFNAVISFVGKTRMKFGSMLNDTRRYYLLQGLRVLHRRARSGGSGRR